MKIISIGGGGFAVSMLLTSNNVVRIPQRNIVIEKNVISKRFGGFEAFGFNGREAATSERPYDIVIRGNKILGCEKPFVIDGIRGIGITGNSFVDCREHGEIGYQSTVANALLAENIFDRVGQTAPGFALWVRDTVNLAIRDNRFIDSGRPPANAGTAIAFVTGESRNLQISGNRFTSPGGRMSQSVLVFREARIDSNSLKLGENVSIGLPLSQVFTARH